MPCRDADPSCDSVTYRNTQHEKQTIFDWIRDNFISKKEPKDALVNITLGNRCDELAQMLCWLCGTLEDLDVDIDLTENPKLFDWWKKHQESDEKRVREEMEAAKTQFKTPSALAKYFINRAQLVHPVSHFHQAWFHKLAKEFFPQEEVVKEIKPKAERILIENIENITPEFIEEFKNDMIKSFKNNLGKGYREQKLDQYGDDEYKDLYRMVSVIIDNYKYHFKSLPTLEQVIYVLQNSFEYSNKLVDNDMPLVKQVYEFHYDARN